MRRHSPSAPVDSSCLSGLSLSTSVSENQWPVLHQQQVRGNEWRFLLFYYSLPFSEEPSTDRQTDTRPVPCFGVATSLWQPHQEVSVRRCRKSSFSGLSPRWPFTYATFQQRLKHNMHCSYTDYQNTNVTQGMRRAGGGMWILTWHGRAPANWRQLINSASGVGEGKQSSGDGEALMPFDIIINNHQLFELSF
ncbi:hypothetical protein Q8A67_019086 [Cirrhinus molitorella]|uniref:Uncharacterized protein n=1 Tax=Cirrhinus molitorella TaxID=172907 RepID=A0AA88P6J2_9TELE|nr:hypothetical protein Q8A67_019086 [Cirrhinus molitorella]